MIKLTRICTEEQVDNLRKLLVYLKALPGDYAHFDMSNYCYIYRPAGCDILLSAGDRPSLVPSTPCESCGCLVGHGPYAGIKPYPSEHWPAYSKRVFGTQINDNCPLWSWLFSAEWAENHNTLVHAIGRLEQVLDTGNIPEVKNYF